VRSAHILVCGFTNRKSPLAFRSDKIQNKVLQKSPQRTPILAWYNRFAETGCVSHTEPGQSRPCVANETIENVRQTFVRSPRKSTKRASLKLIVPKTTLWNILKKRFRCKPYRLQLVQALSDGNKEKRHEFCGEMFDKMKNEYDYLN
jgi:hypothetical protein